MNANLTLSEILTISVIILIVFGPHRLPELARKAGVAVSKLRQAAGSVRQELTSSTEEFTKPLADIDRDLRAAKADLKAAIPGLGGSSPIGTSKPALPTPGSTPGSTVPVELPIDGASDAPVDAVDAAEPGETPPPT